jgi:hypothetical protein
MTTAIPSTSPPSGTAAKSTANLEHSSDSLERRPARARSPFGLAVALAAAKPSGLGMVSPSPRRRWPRRGRWIAAAVASLMFLEHEKKTFFS